MPLPPRATDLSYQSEGERAKSIMLSLWCFIGYNERWMLNAEAAAEREGWTNFPASGRTGKCGR